MEDEESLEAGALIWNFSNTIKGEVDELLADGVVTSGVVVGGIFFASDQLLRVEQLAVSTGTDFICKSRVFPMTYALCVLFSSYMPVIIDIAI